MFLIYLAGYLNNDAGASHGGEGGKDSSNNRATPYDNFMEPSDMGTGCGSAKGGGYLKVRAEDLVELKGTITAKYEHIFWIYKICTVVFEF